LIIARTAIGGVHRQINAPPAAIRLPRRAGAVRICRVFWTAQAALEYREVVEVHVLVRIEPGVGAQGVRLGNSRTKKAPLEFGEIRQIDVAVIVEIARDWVCAGACLTTAALTLTRPPRTDLRLRALVIAGAAIEGVRHQIHACRVTERLPRRAGAVRIRRVIWTAQAALEYLEVVEVHVLVRVEPGVGTYRVHLRNSRTQKARLEVSEIRKIDVPVIVEITRDHRAGLARERPCQQQDREYQRTAKP
jgi:hypothetical protein